MLAIRENEYLTPKGRAAKIVELFGFDYSVDVNVFIADIFKERFPSTTSKKGGAIQFDYFKDFDLLYAIYKRDFNIDLIHDKVMWWEFTSILECISLEKNALTERMGARGYVRRSKKHDYESENNRSAMNKKLKYSILPKNNNNVQAELGKMFRVLEKKAVK